MLEPGVVGPVETRNRIVRAGTSESASGSDGAVTDALVALHERLAMGGVGLIFTGHMFCHPRGRYEYRQTGIETDERIPGLRRLTDSVHRHGGKIFAQVAHAGSQSVVASNDPVAPSPVPNVMTGRQVEQASVSEIHEAIAAFAGAAARAVEAGFDGVHIHGANGYLISEFRSPLTNRRTDEWGGAQDRCDAFPLAVVGAVRAVLPRETGLSMKLGFEDLVDEDGGLTPDEAIVGARRFVDAGLDAVEVSSNLMSDYERASIVPYVAVGKRRALEDLLPHRLLKAPAGEAYFLPYARRARELPGEDRPGRRASSNSDDGDDPGGTGRRLSRTRASADPGAGPRQEGRVGVERAGGMCLVQHLPDARGSPLASLLAGASPAPGRACRVPVARQLQERLVGR